MASLTRPKASQHCPSVSKASARSKAFGYSARVRVSRRFLGYALGSALENHDEEGVSSDPRFGENKNSIALAMAWPCVGPSSSVRRISKYEVRNMQSSAPAWRCALLKSSMRGIAPSSGCGDSSHSRSSEGPDLLHVGVGHESASRMSVAGYGRNRIRARRLTARQEKFLRLITTLPIPSLARAARQEASRQLNVSPKDGNANRNAALIGPGFRT